VSLLYGSLAPEGIRFDSIQGKGMEKEGAEWLKKAAAAGVQEAKAALAKA